MKGIIYKVELGDEVYIGSTTAKLSKRQCNHNSDLRRGNFTSKHQLYSKCLEKGIEKIKCIWVEDYDFEKLEHLREREEYYRKKFNEIKGGNILNTNRVRLNYQDDLDDNKKYNDKRKEWKKAWDKHRNSIKYSCLFCKRELTLRHKARHERTEKHCENILEYVLERWQF